MKTGNGRKTNLKNKNLNLLSKTTNTYATTFISEVILNYLDESEQMRHNLFDLGLK